MRTWIRGLRRFFGGLRTVWLILGVTLLLVVLLEGSLRVVRNVWRANGRTVVASRSGFRGAEWARDYIDELLVSMRVQWQPYVYMRGRPFAGRYINIDEDGLRRTPQVARASSSATSAPEQKIAIWLVGGSAAWGWGARDEHTIAAELARELATAGYAVEVSNFAQLGYVSTQEVLALYYELRAGRRPDAVVFLSGFNDLAAALQEGVAGNTINEFHRRAEFNANGLVLAVRDSAMMWLAKGLSRQGGLMPDTRQGVGGPGQPTLESLAGDVLRVYAENLRLIERIRPDYEFEALYYWQPVVFWKKELSGDEVEVAKTYPQLKELLVHVRAGFVTTPLLSGAVPFRDLTGLFDDSPEPVFIDACHFSEASNQIMAREIARDLAPILDARAAASAP